MSIDGALVMDRGFRILGFGAEILGEGHVTSVHKGLDLEAEATSLELSASYGTRHRSAFRLVSGMSDALALVVSQDGAVSFVAYHNGKVTYWPYVP